MADAKRTIELVFEGVDKTAAATDAVLKNMKKFSGNVQTATQPIADFTASALKFEAALLGAGLAVTGFSIKVASDFQSAVADLAKVLSDTDDIEQYKDLALELSTAYGVASTDVLSAIANYKQAGFTAEEAGVLTKAGLDLVIAGNVEAARSSDLLVASLKGFGAEASRSTELVDLLNEVSNNYAATTDQLLEGFAQLSPIASAAGFSLQETIGILTPGIEVFQSGSEVANALRTSLLRLVDDSAPVQAGLEQLGVSQRDANGELRSARDIYFDVAEALQGVDENQKLYIASQLVGIQRSSQFVAITNGLAKTNDIAAESFDFLGSAAKEVAIQLNTAEVAGNRVAASFTNLFIGIGTPLLDEFTGISAAIIDIFAEIGRAAEGDNGLAEVIAFIESQMAGLEDTLRAVAENLPAALEGADFSGFINGVKAVTDSVTGLFDGIDLTTPEGLTKVIETLGKAFEGLSEFSAGVIDSFKPLFDQLVNIADGVTDLDAEVFRTLGNLAGFATQANIVAGALADDLIPAIKAVVGIIGINQAVGLIGTLKALTGAIGVASGGGALAAVLALTNAFAVGVSGFAIGSALNEVSEAVTGTSISTGLTDLAIKLGLVEDEATRIANTLNDDTVPAIDRTGKAADESSDGLSKFSGTLEEIVPNTATIYDLSEALAAAANKTGELDDRSAPLKGTFSVISSGSDSAADSLKRLGEAADQLQLEEKLALIEAQTRITTAQIEANAQQTVAAFDSINTGIGVTTQSIVDLFGLLGDDNISKFDKLSISDQIELQNERLNEEFELQARLTEAQIKALNAQTARLRSDTPLITVNGDGLAPHLEAMMFEVLEAIQVRVNSDGYAMLLGI